MPARFLHVTASGNRESIQEHGLDWRRIGAAGWCAVSQNTTPDADGNFLARDDWEVEYFADMGLSGALVEVDVWEVLLDVDSPDEPYADPPAPFFEVNGYLVWPYVIPPDQLNLLRTTSQRGRFFGDPDPDADAAELESTGTNSIWIPYEPASDEPLEGDVR